MSAGVGSKYYSGFNPLNLGDCALWLDAADSSTITLSGANVTTWADKSGNGYNLSQSSAGNRPTYSNGVVNFNAASSNSMSNTTTNVFGATGTVFIVMNIQSTTSTMRPFSIGNGNTYITFDSAGAATAAYYNNTSGYFSASNQSAPTTGNRHIRMVQRNGSVVPRYSVNGGTITNMEFADSVVSSTMHITVGTGGSFATTAFLTGHIAEIIGYTSYLSDSDIRQVEGYLAWKWGLQTTPASYSSFVPTQISGCSLWLDAADATKVSLSGSNITGLTDKSANGFVLSNASNFTYNQVKFNGTYPSFHTTGAFSSGHLGINSALRLSQPFTAFVVGQATADSGKFPYILDSAPPSPSSRVVLYYWNNAGYRVRLFAGGEIEFNTGASAPFINTYRVNTTASEILLNGTSVASGSIGSGSLVGIIVGNAAANDSTQIWGGHICEVLLYNSLLSTTQRQQVEGYLAWKWGLLGNLPNRGLPTTHPYSSILPVVRPFQPIDIDGCALWLDAADPSTLTLSGSNVTAWADKSGNARNTSGVSGTPVLSNNSILSRQGVYFNGSSYFTGPFSYSSNTLSWFVVGTVESDGESFGRLLSLGTAGQFDFDSALRMNALSRESNTTELVSYRNYTYIGRNMNISYGTPFVTSSVINGTSNFPYLNGALATGAATSSNFGFTTYGISGSFGANIQRNKGFIFEVLIYTGVLTSNERQQVEGYLARKWGLQGSTSSLTTFIPTQISGCALWLDAADSATVTLSGSNVTAWADKSGNARNASVVGTITRSNTINGVNAMVYSGASNTYFTGAVTNTGTTLTAIAVFIMNSSSFDAARVISLSRPATFDYDSALYASPILRRVGSNLGSFRNFANVSVSAALGIPTLFSSVYNGSSNIIHLNGGTSNSVASTGNFGYTIYQVGSSIREESFANYSGSIGEVIVYNAALTTTERQQVEGYLARKWGLAGSLPSTHPFVLAGLPSTHPFISRLPMTTSFNPRQISNCALWLDAADRYTLTLSGSNVTAWADKSPNQFVGTVFNSPVYTQNALGQCPGVAFNGSSQYISFGNVLNMGTSSIYVFSVCKYDTTGDGTIIAKSSYRGNPGRWWLTRAAVDGGQTMGISPTLETVGLASFSDTTTNVQLVSGYWDRSAVFIFQNGTQRATTSLVSSSNLSNTDPLYVAAYPNSTGTAPNTIGGYTYLNGKIGEIIVYNGSLTVSQRQQVEGYLAWKWGLQGSLSLRTTFSVPGISGCTLWLDAADSSTFTFSSGSNISQWRDKSSSALTGTAVNSPTLIQSGINGFPSVSFNGSSQYINFGNVLNMGTNHIYVFVVCQFSSTANGGVVGKTSARDNRARWALVRESGDMIMIIEGSSVAINNCRYADSSTRARVLTGYWDRSNVYNLENGIQRAVVALSDTTSLSNTDPLYVGAYPNSTGTGPLAGFYFGGTIAEILVYQAALTTTQRQQVETYLASKWGVSGLGLPSTHPYKTISPI